MVEDAFANLLSKSSDIDQEVMETRLLQCICYYASQNDFKVDGLFKKMEDKGCTDEILKKLGEHLSRMSFIKKLKENVDEKYHVYLPEDNH